MTARVWIWLLSLSVLWGGSFFFAKVALGELAPRVLGALLWATYRAMGTIAGVDVPGAIRMRAPARWAAAAAHPDEADLAAAAAFVKALYRKRMLRARFAEKRS